MPIGFFAAICSLQPSALFTTLTIFLFPSFTTQRLRQQTIYYSLDRLSFGASGVLVEFFASLLFIGSLWWIFWQGWRRAGVLEVVEEGWSFRLLGVEVGVEHDGLGLV
ncbi:hypothetical protein B0H63DRAFT_44508 [Podospora didyma]|uniref:Uncharacterized protein n=1 Tax=Podospora didyma TaxID=330526 RepID=A0AAE0P6U3_9PEZI|nr:hypothetical protein B0H63DRAFT_44508 [Podospora didyma]